MKIEIEIDSDSIEELVRLWAADKVPPGHYIESVNGPYSAAKIYIRPTPKPKRTVPTTGPADQETLGFEGAPKLVPLDDVL